MSAIILPLSASAIVCVLYLALTAVLLRKYKSTGDVGFVWLGAAVVLWPIVSNALGWSGHALTEHLMTAHLSAPHSSHGSGMGFSGALPIFLGVIQQLVGVGLLLIAIHFFAKSREKPERAA